MSSAPGGADKRPVRSPLVTQPAPDVYEPLRREVAAVFAARLQPRRSWSQGSMLGSGGEELDAGRAHLAALEDGGWAVPTWPTTAGGRGLDSAGASAIGSELARFEVPDLYPFLIGLRVAGPVVMELGTTDQQGRWLPAIRTGAEIWCQLFSEPDAGSDLAGLITRAERDGDGWRVTGSKVWTSRGHYARWGLLLARSDWTVPKHAGITAFGLDLHSPGVVVRPLRQINGDEHFSQVFLDSVFVPDTDRVGEVGRGWGVARTALAHERGAVGSSGSSGLPLEQLLNLARAMGREDDPNARQQLADLYVRMEVSRVHGMRVRDLARGGRAGPEGSGTKLTGALLYQRFARVAMDLLGPAAVAWEPSELVDDAGELRDVDWRTLFLTSPSLSIRGGTDEIQRNIVGEQVLGLPREPAVDRDVPFEDLPR